MMCGARLIVLRPDERQDWALRRISMLSGTRLGTSLKSLPSPPRSWEMHWVRGLVGAQVAKKLRHH